MARQRWVVNEMNEWRIELGDGNVLRQSARSDRLRLGLLGATTRWVHESRGGEALPTLLADHPGTIWQRGGVTRGVLLVSLHRAPVFAVRRLMYRDGADRGFFFDTVLEAVEARLRDLGAHWLSFDGCANWLVHEIEPRGYTLQDEVIHYEYHMGGELPVGNDRVVVRRATEADVPDIVAVDWAAFDPFWRMNEPLLRQAIPQTVPYLVASWQGAVVGYIMAEARGQLGYIGRLGVLPEHQGQGIGTRLMSAGLERLRAMGATDVLLNTQRGNRRSRTLYEKLGFVATGQVEAFWARSLAHALPDRDGLVRQPDVSRSVS